MEQFDEFVQKERERQDRKWGVQNHEPLKWLAILGEEVGEVNKAALEGCYSDMREELVQVAAVCKAMYECAVRCDW
jgi:NTP pyrophosphatase (non-canonical NTP hydrolase)